MIRYSIITVVKNSELTIDRTIRSVLNQTFNNFEYIVWDGLSTDNTYKIISNYKNNKRLKIIQKKDNGPGDAYIQALKFARGQIVGFLNADDYFTSNKSLEIINDNFSNNVDATYGGMNYLNNKGKISRVWKSEEYYPGAFLDGWSLPFPTFYVRRSIYKKFGYLNSNINISDDYELTYRLIHKYKIRIKFISHILVNFSSQGRSSRIFNRIIGNINIIKILKNDNSTFNTFFFLIKRFKKKLREFV